MTRRRDPFAMALESLRFRAEQGAFAPGSPVVIMDEARRLGLSTTPVREALVWLSGYGLVERSPTGGFLAPRMDRAIVRDRYAFRLQCVLESLAVESQGAGREAGADAESAAAGLAERMLCSVRMTGNAALVDAYRRVCSQLIQVQAVETRLFDDVKQEANALLSRFGAGAAREGLVEALRHYHQRRIEAAPLLILQVEAGRGGLGDDA